MYGKTRIAVLAENLGEFAGRLGELSKIFTIKLTSPGTAELVGANELVEVIYIDDAAHLAGCEYDGYIALPGAHRHREFDRIMQVLPSRLRQSRRAVR
jgi:hypothetical protein